MENRSTVCPWLLTSLFLLRQVTAQSLGSSMYNARMLMYWFASTPTVSWHIRHTAGASACYHDCELCPKSRSPANVGCLAWSKLHVCRPVGRGTKERPCDSTSAP